MKKTIRNTLAIIGLAGLATGFALATKPAHAWDGPQTGERYAVDGRYEPTSIPGDRTYLCGIMTFTNTVTTSDGVDFDYQTIWYTSETTQVARLGSGDLSGDIISFNDLPAGDPSIPFFSAESDPIQYATFWSGDWIERTGDPVEGRWETYRLRPSQGVNCTVTWRRNQ